MSAREELAKVIVTAYGEDAEKECPCEQDLDVADAILAAGYRKPRTITTAKELDVLPMGSVVLDAQGWVAVILPAVDGQRCLRVAKAGDNLWALNSLVAQRMLPATVLYEPEQP